MAVITETRDVGGFTEVAIQGYGDLIIEQKPDGPESLIIEADEMIMPKISSRVRNNRLALGFDLPWYEWVTYGLTWLFMPNKVIRYHLTMKTVSNLSISGSGSVTAGRIQTGQCRFQVSGSGKIRISDITAQSLITMVSGSGDIELGGTAQRHEIHISGAGTLKARGMKTQRTIVRISGSGKVLADASETLDVRISGSGNVQYSGQPKISQDISGSGRIEQLTAQAAS